ncbi:MAG: hypothetical protein EZS28_000554 [Streblomastix strix]|uniref:Uncharacterized protein n=1 Tax=Streblomastix strix TaxID=222440 RepID=A0A5J4XAT6_9EUKA|nr:MAG: hypothetical protein EZS28_000554 [Streblomastix strix]
MADNKAVNESTQTEAQSETLIEAVPARGPSEDQILGKQGRPKKYTDKEQATIAAREQRKNARIRYKQNQTNYTSKHMKLSSIRYLDGGFFGIMGQISAIRVLSASETALVYSPLTCETLLGYISIGSNEDHRFSYHHMFISANLIQTSLETTLSGLN